MEVIFDGALLKPVLSPTMKTALSVISLIANSLVEANKCMKKRLADEAGQPSTLDEVMKQSGLNIPGLEEALARLMGGGDEARKAAAMVVNTPDPADLLRAFVGFDAPGDQHRQQVVHLTRFVVEFDFPKQLHVFDAGRGKNGFVALPRSALNVAAVCQPIGEFASLRLWARVKGKQATEQR